MRLDKIAVGDVWEENHARFDTQDYYGQVALGTLADRYLGDQGISSHDPLDDARATMLLYLRVQPFEGRTDFKDPPFMFNKEDFPAL